MNTGPWVRTRSTKPSRAKMSRFAGGIGTVAGSMVGGLVMGVLNLGLANLSVDSNFIQVIKGMALRLAVAFDVLSKVQGRPSFIGMMLSGMHRTSSPPPTYRGHSPQPAGNNER